MPSQYLTSPLRWSLRNPALCLPEEACAEGGPSNTSDGSEGSGSMSLVLGRPCDPQGCLTAWLPSSLDGGLAQGIPGSTTASVLIMARARPLPQGRLGTLCLQPAAQTRCAHTQLQHWLGLRPPCRTQAPSYKVWTPGWVVSSCSCQPLLWLPSWLPFWITWQQAGPRGLVFLCVQGDVVLQTPNGWPAGPLEKASGKGPVCRSHGPSPGL